jgi:hypothetical protein
MDENPYKTAEGRRRRDRLITILFLVGALMAIPGAIIAAKVVGRPWNDSDVLLMGFSGVVAMLLLWRFMLWFVRRTSPYG